MRHNNTINHLGRTSSHRKAMLSNMACSLITSKRIKTTLAKAKALKTFVEPIITKSKEDTTHNRRTAFRYLKDKNAVTVLFREVATKISERNGGYTRILKLGKREGDAADICYIELVDYNANMLKGTKATATDAKKPRTRRAGAAKKKAEATVVATTPVEETKE